MSPTLTPLQALHSIPRRSEEIKETKREMSTRVSNIADLIHRVGSSCLAHRLPGCHGLDNGDDSDVDDDAAAADPHFPHKEHDEAETFGERKEGDEDEDEDDDDEEALRIWEEGKRGGAAGLGRVREMEALMGDVFDTVSAMKRAYVSLQEAHCPWDPDKMRVADAAVVAELRKLGRLRDRFRRSGAGGGRRASASAAPLREAVAPYEAALDDMKRELKAKETEVESLKEKLRSSTALGGSARRGRFHSSKRVGCITGLAGLQGSPTPELFELCMEQVKATTKSFTAHLLSLMRSARWDIAAAVRSIVDAAAAADDDDADDRRHIRHPPIPDVGPHHAKYALESYVNRRLFDGFENETFYLDGSLSSLLNPSEFRRDCFAQFRDMRGMEPAELLGILPTCQFGRFAARKYLATVHARMEESLFGGVEQRRQVVAGAHPRTGFYSEFLRAAKAVWMLHLLAFALDPAPAHFEASKGADFHPDYMESVVRFAGGRVPPGWVVAFSVAPGFKLSNGSVVRARVYLVPRSRRGQ
ncbi:IRK-interacting protein [Ananas comosus]|uniref:IRK-interacting protein n=1 Tax=Ananas comosus TaxID=4615 RepID=A0A199VZM6_ANACO|nr:IRK-interacting protein [Ananas comosus]